MKQHLNRNGYVLTAAFVAALTVTSFSARAQTTWTGAGGDGLWNSAANWDGGAPSEFVPGVIGSGFSVNYAAPMSAPRIQGLTLGGSLSINAAGFSIDPVGLTPLSITNGGAMSINSGGVVTISNAGAFRMMDRNTRLAVAGGTLLLGNNFGNVTIGENGNTTESAVTNSGGSITVDQILELRGRYAGFYMTGGTLDLLAGGGIYESSNDNERKFYIGGGTANLGNFLLARTLNGVAQAGLIISNGVVNFTSLRVGTANAASGATVAGGIVTNTGPFLINDRNNGATSGNRRISFYQLGGSIYSTDPAGIIVANQSNGGAAAASVMGGFLDIRGGLLLAEGITLVKDATLQNAHATLTLSGGEVYLGPVGLVGNVGVSGTSYTMNLNGGTLGAQSDFSILGDGTLGGDFTLKAAGPAGAAHNITHNGVWSGAGSLRKTGAGTLALMGANTFAGPTTIAEGTLVLGLGGAVSSSTRIEVAEGATFDVSATAPYALNSGQTLAGDGSVSGSVTAQSGSTISPGLSAGELTFLNDLALRAGAITSLELSAVTNDVVRVTGTLDISGGTSTVLISPLGGPIPAGTYTLFRYGTLNGSVANLSLVGVLGTLVDDPVAKTISVTTSAVRGATDVTWVGNATANVWDILNATNWLNAGVLDYFVSGDRALFNNTGAANPLVNITEIVQPGSVLVNSTSDYTFTGSGWISGETGLTKTNTGRLRVATTNDFTGVTRLAGGTLETELLAPASMPSAIGAGNGTGDNLVFDGGALAYTGPTLAFDRSATLNIGGGTINVVSNDTSLNISGSFAGDGALTKAGPGRLALAAAGTHAGGLIVNEGTLRMEHTDAGGTNNLVMNGGLLDLQVDLNADSQVVVINGNVAISIGANRYIDGGLAGAGTLLVADGALPTDRYLTINGDMQAFSGTIDLGNGAGNFRFNRGGADISLGSSNALFNLGTNAASLVNRNGAGKTYHVGALVGGAGTKVSGRSSGSGGDGTFWSIGGRNESTRFDGVIQNGGDTVHVVKVGAGTLTLSGNHTYTGTTLVEQGTLALVESAAIGTSSSIMVGSGATLNVSGLFTPTLFLNFGQTLGGEGTVVGGIDTSFGGTVAPGASIGTLTVTGNAALSGSTVMEINRGSIPKSDKLAAPTITLAGTLTVANIGYNLQVGDTFDLFDGTITDGGVSLIAPAGYTFDTSMLIVNGTITVTGAPAPPQVDNIALDSSGTNLVLSGSGGTPFGLYDVLSSADVAAPLNTWTVLSVGNFYDSNGSFAFTNAIDPARPIEFYLIRQQ